jgi:polar amino acid transport system substrate-binding protein
MIHRSARFLPLALVLTLSLVAAGCGDDDTDTGSSANGDGGGALTICSDIPYEPMEFEAPPGEETPSGYTGFDIDLVQAIADDADRTLEVRVTPFDGIFAAMDAGQCDAVVSSVSITEERERNMNFTEPYFDSEQSIMTTRENAAEFTTLESLAGKRIGVQSGTTGESFVQENLPDGATVIALPGAADLFAALGNTIDAIVQDYPINAYRTTVEPDFVVSARLG